MSILQGLALKDFLGSIAINPGELAWHEEFESYPPLSLPCVYVYVYAGIFVLCWHSGGFSWNSSQELPKLPSVTLMFPLNNSFVVHNPVFMINGDQVSTN